MRECVVSVVLVAGLSACTTPPSLVVREVASPAATSSGEPSLSVGADGRASLSWIEDRPDGGHALRFAHWDGTAWSAAGTVSEGNDWFVNWADFPSITSLAGDSLLAHWLRKTGEGPYAYAVMLSTSRDGGTTWSTPLRPHDDSPTEHGFVSLVPLPQGRAAIVWLDGRETGSGHLETAGPMTLRAAFLGADGRIERSDLVDPRVCDCCQTSAVRLDDGAIVVAYRDRSETEVRDIATVRFEDGRWSAPRTIHDDRWVIAGCPVNGPSVAAEGNQVAVAWFTGAGPAGSASVRLALSRDGGRSFEPPRDVDSGDPTGRVGVVLLEDGTPLVSWMEGRGDQAAILVRRVPAGGGRLADPLLVARTTSARTSGFPRMTRLGSQVLVAWTDPSDPPWVRTALLVQGS